MKNTNNQNYIQQNLYMSLNSHRRSSIIRTCICLALYLLGFYLFRFFSVYSTSATSRMYSTIAMGAVQQLMMIVSVILVVFEKKHGFYLSIIFNTLSLITLIARMINGLYSATPGILSIIGTFLSTAVILSLWNRIDKVVDTLNQMAYIDNLTGIPNRKTFLDCLSRLTFECSQTNESFYIVYVDLDHFKNVNDSLGHHVGDYILNEIVSRWKGIVHPDDIIGRLGGDEFGIIVKRQLSKDEIIHYVNSFANKLSHHCTYNRKRIYLSGSFGIAEYPQDGIDATKILKCADMSMYVSKENRNNTITFFDNSMLDAVNRRLALESHLKKAMEQNEFYLVYQPQFYTDSKHLRGFEVLLRWENPELGLVEPNDFISITEETGMIVPLGRWILTTACENYQKHSNSFSSFPILSVNISSIQLNDPDFLAMVKEVLTETGFNPENLELEMTESAMIDSHNQALDVLHELRSLGIHIALDNFGTGYSSLCYLQQMSINTLKLDKSFITPLLQQEGKEKLIVRSVIDMAHQLNLQIVAQGVEVPEQVEYLKKFDCNFIQGFYWGRPSKEFITQVNSTHCNPTHE